MVDDNDGKRGGRVGGKVQRRDEEGEERGTSVALWVKSSTGEWVEREPRSVSDRDDRIKGSSGDESRVKKRELDKDSSGQGK